MDNFLIEYRDPLFGILIFLILIFIVSFFSYWWAYYKKKEQENEITRFLKKFEENGDKEILNIHSQKDTQKAFLLLALAYEKSGDFEKAIALYLNLSKECGQLYKKIEYLKKIGILYFKIGFLQKSKDIFLEVLKFFPRDKESLKYLMFIFEKLQDFRYLNDVLVSLEELNIDKKEIDYTLAFSLVKKRSKDYEKLVSLYKENFDLTRIVFEYLFNVSPFLAWEKLDKRHYELIGDIFWNLEKEQIDLEKVKKSNFLKELYSAKGYFNLSNKSDIFEFNILINLKDKNVALDFEYLCKNCKHIFPIPFTRCPNCYTPQSPIVEYILTKKREIDEENLYI